MEHTLLYIYEKGQQVDLRFLGIHIIQRIFLLQKLKMTGLSPQLLTNLYTATT